MPKTNTSARIWATGVWGHRGVGLARLCVGAMRWGTFRVVNIVATLWPALRIFVMSARASGGHWRARGMDAMKATSGIKSWACSSAEPFRVRTWVFAMCAHSSATVRKVGTSPAFLVIFSLESQYTHLPSEYWTNELEQAHALLARFLCAIIGLEESAFCAKRKFSLPVGVFRCIHAHLRAVVGHLPLDPTSLEKGGSRSIHGFSCP